jgi:hypothetical protein
VNQLKRYWHPQRGERWMARAKPGWRLLADGEKAPPTTPLVKPGLRGLKRKI